MLTRNGIYCRRSYSEREKPLGNPHQPRVKRKIKPLKVAEIGFCTE
jgi:hypothetical protein